MGGGGGGAGSSLPKYAQDIADILFRDPQDAFSASNRGGLGSGIFGDVLAGYMAGSAPQLFGGLTGGIPAVQQGSANYFGIGASNPAYGPQSEYAGMGRGGALNSTTYNNLVNSFLDASNAGYSRLLGLAGGQGGPGMAGPFSGSVTPAALSYASKVGVNDDVVQRATKLARASSDAAFAARGMATSGPAIQAGNDLAQRIADTEIQRVNEQRAQLLGVAAQGEGANAAMTNALNQAQNDRFRAQVAAAQGATQAPSEIFQGLQAGLGRGLQNLGTAQSLYLTPLQGARAAFDLMSGASSLPIQYQQAIYNYLRSPQTQLMAGLAGANPLQKAGSSGGLLGSLLGYSGKT